ncbi:MAG: nuclear transport factor 2 family protein [Xanthomonadales bacterium]|nr:nuclear transport factor 2 family protein [Xanthomonadales bacterium]
MQGWKFAVTGLLAGLLAACAAGNVSRRDSAPAHAVPDRAPAHEPGATAGALFDTVEALDTALFDAFNRCADPAQFARHAEWIDPSIEFYHDKGGADFGGEKYLASVKANVCGKFERKRVPGTLRVYPIPGYGAIALGVHVFCPFASERCEGAGDFLMVWKQDGERWRLTRAVSYAHRSAAPTGP